MFRRTIVLTAVAAAVTACSADEPVPTEFVVTAPLYAKGGNSDNNMGTHLTGDEEVLVVAPGAPHPSDSRAQGQAIFRVKGNTVSFRLIATNIDNVIMAHIHCGRFGENGPIRMWLWPVIGPSGAQAPNGGGRQSGVLASGEFDPAGQVCPALNVGVDMPLLEAMRAGLTYVNVHTNDGVGLTNTGPGDFPGGEIRGQFPD